jgi:hypothetical protein
MELKALRRLENGIDRMLESHRKALERQNQLSAALAKTKDELERTKAELERYRREKTDTRKRVDALLKRFEGLGIDWGRPEA